MFTCGDCADSDCEGKLNPEAQQCDNFALEVYEDATERHSDGKVMYDEIRMLQSALLDTSERIDAVEARVDDMFEMFYRIFRAVQNEYRDDF